MRMRGRAEAVRAISNTRNFPGKVPPNLTLLIQIKKLYSLSTNLFMHMITSPPNVHSNPLLFLYPCISQSIFCLTISKPLYAGKQICLASRYEEESGIEGVICPSTWRIHLTGHLGGYSDTGVFARTEFHGGICTPLDQNDPSAKIENANECRSRKKFRIKSISISVMAQPSSQQDAKRTIAENFCHVYPTHLIAKGFIKIQYPAQSIYIYSTKAILETPA